MRIVPAILVILLAALPILADDAPDDAAVRKAIRSFRKRFAAEEMAERMRALWDLSRVKHDKVIVEIGKRVLADPDPDVRAAGALLLGKIKADPEVAGPFLRDRLPLEDLHPDVQVALIRAIRAIGYTGACEELYDAALRFLEEDYRFVTSEVLKTLGALKDVAALPFLLKLSEFNFEAIRGRRGPTMRFSSSTPTVVRRWIWMRKYGKHAFPKGHPGEIVKWWLGDLVEAVTAITGEKFEDAGALRRWLTVNAKRLGIRKSELDKRKKLEPKEPRKPAKDEED